jgi:type I restriction enzyme S subunit
MIFRKLSEVAPPKPSSTKPAPNDSVWHLTLDQIESGSGQIVNRVYGRASDAGSSTFAFDNGNVLYSKLRPYLNKVICPDTNGIATTELVPLRPNPSELNREYLCSYLRSPKFVSWASSQVDGAKMPRMKMKSFWAYEIPVPPLDDQIRIAHLLGRVDGLIAQRKQHLQYLDDLLKSVFLEMFGDPILNPHDFPLRTFSEFYVNTKEGTKCGPFGSALKKEELVDSGVPVWNMDNIATDGRMVLPFRMWITTEKYEKLVAYSVKDGDIIISRAGTVGKMCVARMGGQPAIISTNLIRVRLGDELRPLHFVSLMLYCKGRVGRLKTGADGAFTHMNTGVLDSLEFPYPPIELQDQFAAIVEKVEVLKSRYQQSLTDLEALYDVLSQQAFKGELDLSRVPLPKLPTQHIAPVSIGDQATVPEPVVQTTVTAIHLPDTGNLLAALENSEARKALIAEWLEAYRQQLGDAPFSVQDFMVAVSDRLTEWLQTVVEDEAVADEKKNRLAEFYPSNDVGPDVNDYEHIKKWVFEALAAGALTQGGNNGGNRIELKAVQS